MTWQIASRTAADTGSGLFADGFTWGTFLLVMGMVVALAVVSSLGILARIRDNATRARPAAAASAATAAPEDAAPPR